MQSKNKILNLTPSMIVQIACKIWLAVVPLVLSFVAIQGFSAYLFKILQWKLGGESDARHN